MHLSSRWHRPRRRAAKKSAIGSGARGCGLLVEQLESRELLATTPLRFDFGTTTSPVASGYTRVTTQSVYSPTQHFGWLSGAIGSRDRGVGTSLTRDFNFTNKGTFGVDLANGTYQVAVTIGDTAYAHPNQVLSLEGVQLAVFSTAGGQFFTKTYTVTVGDGQLTVGLRGLTSAYLAFINSLTISPLTVAGPVVEAGANVTAQEGQAVAFAGTVAAGQSPFTYSWSFGDGTTAVSAITSHVYKDNGVYTATFSVKDVLGRTSSDTRTITVTNVTPSVIIGGLPTSGHVTQGKALALTSSVSDPSVTDTTAGFTYAWTLTMNNATVATGTSATFSFTPAQAGSYVVKLSASDKNGGVGQASKTFTADPLVAPAPAPAPAPASGDHVLLPATTLTSLRQEAATNAPRWLNYKAYLDKYLNTVVVGGYIGGQNPWIAWYALGYQVLKDLDPATASKYADKAIAVIKSALADHQRGANTTKQFRARGDGVTKSFTIPNANYVPSSLKVYMSAVQTVARVRGGTPTPYTPTSMDQIPIQAKVLKVSKTSDGPADYAQFSSWIQNPNYLPYLIDWSPSGAEPAKGATYYITYAEPSNTYSASIYQPYTVSGTTITFNTAPRKDQAIFLEYVYGTQNAAHTSLGYQQTSEGLGGFNSIAIENNFSSRYLGKYLAIGLDWLDGYAGFMNAPSVTWHPPLPTQPTLRSDIMTMLVRWNDFLKTQGYSNAPLTNYGMGSYVSRVMTAVALLPVGRDPVNGNRILSEVLAPDLRGTLVSFLNGTRPGTTLKGGYYHEGWNYGGLATQNILMSGLALEMSGGISATAERQYANEVIPMLLTGSPDPSTVYNGGELYHYPLSFPSSGLWQVLSSATTSPTLRSYANYVLQHYEKPHIPSIEEMVNDMLFADPSATGTYWSALPLAHFAVGGGLQLSRSSWGSNPTWVAAQFQNMLDGVGHDAGTPGNVQIMRGAVDLLVNANAVGLYLGNHLKSRNGNLVYIQDATPGYQKDLGATAGKYTAPGVQVKAQEAKAGYSYIYGDTTLAYRNIYTGLNPVTELTRQVVHLQPDYVVVYDRVTSTNTTATKRLQWHFLNPPTVTGNSFVATAGQSKLFGQTFSTTPLVTTAAPVTVGDATVRRVSTQPSISTKSVRYVSAFQVAPSSTASMAATKQILSTDSRMEGVQMGNRVVLFGRNGNVDLSTPVTYQVGAGSITQLLTNVTADRSYQIRVNGTLVATVASSSQGTLSFTTSATGSPSIQVTRI